MLFRKALGWPVAHAPGTFDENLGPLSPKCRFHDHVGAPLLRIEHGVGCDRGPFRYRHAKLRQSAVLLVLGEFVALADGAGWWRKLLDRHRRHRQCWRALLEMRIRPGHVL